MEKNDSAKPQRKKNMGKLRIAFSSMILFILFLAEIYLMVNSSQYFEGFVAVTVLLIAVLYILVTSIIQVNYEKEQRLLDEFDDIFKSEKATYLLMRKSFEDFNERLAYLEDNVKTPTEEIIAAQKAIAKVSISRNKENTDALMNSNDKLLEKLLGFEDLIASANDKLLEQQKLMINQANQEILLKQQEAVMKLKEVELSIKNEILQSYGMAGSVQPKAASFIQPPVMQDMSTAAKEAENSDISSDAAFGEEPDISSMDDFLGSDSELSFGEEDSETVSELSLGEEGSEVISELSLGEEDPGVISELSPGEEDPGVISELSLGEEDSADVSELSSMEDFLQNDLSVEPEILSEEEPVKGTEIIEEPEVESGESELSEVMEEEPVMPEVTSEEAFTEPAATEKEIVAEPPAEEKPPMPDLSDPNKVMTPDEIAALLANVGGEQQESEAESEKVLEEQAVEEAVMEPPAEEKPPMPDLSDPNKVMTPDEIAALLANM